MSASQPYVAEDSKPLAAAPKPSRIRSACHKLDQWLLTKLEPVVPLVADFVYIRHTQSIVLLPLVLCCAVTAYFFYLTDTTDTASLMAIGGLAAVAVW